MMGAMNPKIIKDAGAILSDRMIGEAVDIDSR